MTNPEPDLDAPRPQRRSLPHFVTRQTIQTTIFVAVALAVAWAFALVAAVVIADDTTAADSTPAVDDAAAAPTEPDGSADEFDDAVPAAAVATDGSAPTTEAPVNSPTLLVGTEIPDDLTERLAGRTVHVLGDSLALSASDEISALLGTAVSIDAETGLGLYFADTKVATAAVGADIVVVSLGTNDFDQPEAFLESVDLALDALAPASCVVWVDTQVFGQGSDALVSMNAGILAAAEAYDRVVAGWSKLAGSPELHVSDGYHLSEQGQDLFASLIVSTVVNACL